MPLIEEFIDHLRLEPQGDDVFLGHSRFTSSEGHVFGGQVLGQAVSAAGQTVHGKHCHAFSCQFLRGGNFDLPIEFRVKRVRDGKSFSSRQVSAVQNGRELLRMEASFQVEAEGYVHQPVMPDVPPPETFPPMSAYRADFEALGRMNMYRFLVDNNVFEFRCREKPCYVETRNRPPVQQSWLRSRFPVPGDAALQRSMLGYISDNNFMRTASLPYREELMRSGFQLATLNHSMWIHRTPDLNDWLLYDVHSSVAFGQRGLVIGHMYNRAGELVASVAQEGMIRPLDGEKGAAAFSEGN